jgi:hypothetical protein
VSRAGGCPPDCDCCTRAAHGVGRPRVFERLNPREAVRVREALEGVPIPRVDLVDPHQRAPLFLTVKSGASR